MRSFYNVLSRTVLTALPLVVLFVFAAPAFGDGGSIPYTPNVRVFEPNQRAMISWNGEEEILLLSTDLGATRPTKVLEVFPFPAEPEVTEGDIGVFTAANNLISRKLGLGISYGAPMSSGDMGMGGMEPAPPAARVTFEETIGAHDLAVIQVLRVEGFIEWVEDFLRSQNVANPVIPPPLKQAVEEYMEDGFTWFVFDVVSLTNRPQTKQALQFKFKTNCLYYPLRITRAEQGETLVRLLIVTSGLINMREGMNYGIAYERIRLTHPPVNVSGDELNGISSEMYELLGEPDNSLLRTWQIQGDLSEFHEDLVVAYPSWLLQRGLGSEREDSDEPDRAERQGPGLRPVWNVLPE
jgi:hypothetical protein